MIGWLMILITAINLIISLVRASHRGAYLAYLKYRSKYCPGKNWRQKRGKVASGDLLYPPPINETFSSRSDLSNLKQQSEDEVIENRPEKL